MDKDWKIFSKFFFYPLGRKKFWSTYLKKIFFVIINQINFLILYLLSDNSKKIQNFFSMLGKNLKIFSNFFFYPLGRKKFWSTHLEKIFFVIINKINFSILYLLSENSKKNQDFFSIKIQSRLENFFKVFFLEKFFFWGEKSSGVQLKKIFFVRINQINFVSPKLITLKFQKNAQHSPNNISVCLIFFKFFHPPLFAKEINKHKPKITFSSYSKQINFTL